VYLTITAVLCTVTEFRNHGSTAPRYTLLVQLISWGADAGLGIVNQRRYGVILAWDSRLYIVAVVSYLLYTYLFGTR
jgi:hypothetical protein